MQTNRARKWKLIRAAKVRWTDWSLNAKGLMVVALAVLPLVGAVAGLAANAAAVRSLDNQLPMDREARLRETRLLTLMVDAETGVRGFLLTHDASYLDPYREAVASVPPLLDEIHAHEEVEHGQDFGEVEQLVARELDVLAGLLDDPTPKPELAVGKELMDRFRVVIEQHEAVEDRQIADLVTRRRSLQRQQIGLLGLAVVLSVLSAGGAGILLIRGIAGRVRAATENAGRLADGESLEPYEGGADELGQLQRRIEQTANLLRAKESALRQAIEEADRANRAKSEFLSRMSHELRTPLNAILGFAQLTRSEASGETAADLDQILAAGRHLLALIDEVLDISRIEAGQLSLSVEPVSVPDVVSESVDLVNGAATRRGIRIDANHGGSSPLYVLADRQRLKQVLVNLISNAVKYNREGGDVRVWWEKVNAGVRITVSDTGPGLPSDAAENLFTPFARLGAEATDVEGTGLGLALSRNLIEVMGGDLAAGKSDASGTEFWIHLPWASEPAPQSSPVVTDIEAAADLLMLGRIKVLQVEDNASNIRLMSRIMQRRPNVEMVTTQLGGEAIQLAAMLKPDLILLDLNLPDMSGHDVLTALRNDPLTDDVRVVMLSADASETQIERLMAAGADGYLTKPIEVKRFLEVLDEASAMSRKAS